MRPLKKGVYGMWWSMVLGTGMATISLGVLLYRVDWATLLQSNQLVSCFQIGPVTCKIYKANIQQHGVTHHFLVLGKVWPKIPWCKATWHMTPESETNLSEYVMMLCC